MTDHSGRRAGTDGAAPRSYRGEVLLLLAIAVAAIVFGLRTRSGATKDASDPIRTSAESAAGEVPQGHVTPKAPAIEIPSKGKAPTRPLFTALPFTSEERDRELKRCMAQAQNAVTWPGGGKGSAALVNTGLVGDSLAFVGHAVNLTSGRAIVWRCAIANWDGRVGGSRFTALESIDGVDLEWSKIAAIDDEVLRRCVMKAQALFPGLRIPPFTNNTRKSDDFTLDGVALGPDNNERGGGAWRCHVQLQKGAIASLDVQEPPQQQATPQQPAPPQ
jgi:hypothetical protein